jgi:hypothetical protein
VRRELLESVVTTGNCVGTAGPEVTMVGCFCDATKDRPQITQTENTNAKVTLLYTYDFYPPLSNSQIHVSCSKKGSILTPDFSKINSK